MRRAPAESRKHLKDAAPIAIDDRIAAEILLRFYEDLALRGKAEPLPDLSGAMGWHPLHERLSNRKDTLDEAVTDLGISPHPRVVLALEGETEVYHAPLVWRTLGYSSAPELIRVLKLGGVGQNLQKVAALNVAPLIGKQVPAPGATAWTVIRNLLSDASSSAASKSLTGSPSPHPRPACAACPAADRVPSALRKLISLK